MRNSETPRVRTIQMAQWIADNIPNVQTIDAHGFERTGVPESVQTWIRQHWVANHDANQCTAYTKPAEVQQKRDVEPARTVVQNAFEKNDSGALVPTKQLQANMDNANAKIVDVWRTQGEEAAVDAMFTGDRGARLSYAEMRMRYG